MPELTEPQKKYLSETLYDEDCRVFEDDTAPSPESDAVRAFAAALSSQPPEVVDVQDDDQGLYGWPADAIRRRIAERGGAIRFGWRLREWPGLLLTANFHCVWVDPDGKLIDMTPQMAAGSSSVFVPDAAYADDFDFSQRPTTRYKILHVAPDWSDAVAKRIAAFKPAQRIYEERRAQKAGENLEVWLLRKFPADPLPGLLELFIDRCRDFEAELPGLPDLVIAGTPEPKADAAADAADDEPDAPVSEAYLAAEQCAVAGDMIVEWGRPRMIARSAIMATRLLRIGVTDDG